MAKVMHFGVYTRNEWTSARVALCGQRDIWDNAYRSSHRQLTDNRAAVTCKRCLAAMRKEGK